MTAPPPLIAMHNVTRTYRTGQAELHALKKGLIYILQPAGIFSAGSCSSEK